jgi:hypothetical protein
MTRLKLSETSVRLLSLLWLCNPKAHCTLGSTFHRFSPKTHIPCGWSLHVSLRKTPYLALCHSRMTHPPSFLRWEFFSSLDYEWSVIRGRRPYRWTIWVGNLKWGSTPFMSLGPIPSLSSFIPLPVSPHSWAQL